MRARERAGRIALAVLFATSSAAAQTTTPTTETPNDYPAALPRRKGPAPPALVFKVAGEVALPAAPTGGDPSLEGGRLLVPVEGGRASIDFADPSSARLEEASPAAEETSPPWVLSDDGTFRVRTLPAGRVEAEKKGIFLHRFRHDWSLRVAGATPAPPLIMGPRVMFGSVDNQVYGVRRKNGHRLWAADLDDRVSKPLAGWHRKLPMPAGSVPPMPDVDVEMVLVVPDGGALLVALDVYDGSRLGAFEVPSAKGMFVSGPVVLGDGRIAVARANYGLGGGALVFLQPEVSTAPAKAPAAPTKAPGSRSKQDQHDL